jgi:hypothetical protein
MNRPLNIETVNDPLDSLEVLKSDTAEFSQILMRAAEEVEILQSASDTETFLEGLWSLSPLFAGAGLPHAVWETPALFQSRNERMVQYMLDFAGIVARSQIEIKELMAQSFARSVQQTSRTMLLARQDHS